MISLDPGPATGWAIKTSFNPLLAEQQRNSLLLSGTNFCFEMVYSHPSKIDLLARAKALG
ncbi:hypothetical protein KBY71_13225 [Cyanobium sp. T1B-Tous]|uniref:hypothetical protein n=1 Tax=Cyanobium sp. T1B-Tous TaxID=2823721 RepID=UPI0020CCC1E3|nr:hypothetical protein [Cyanobium sp. T1B-Tous]MCP9807473.1 hypothetical protein [Cyanobium sp. T1B-Tous]